MQQTRGWPRNKPRQGAAAIGVLTLSRKMTDEEPGGPPRPTCAHIHRPVRPLTPTRSLHTCSCVHFSHMSTCVHARVATYIQMCAHTPFLISFCNRKTTVRFENRIFSSRSIPGVRAEFFQAFLATWPSRSLAHNLHQGGLGSPAVPHAPAPKQASSVFPPPSSSLSP